MNKDIFKGKWHELKGKIRQEWADLTDDEVAKIDGKYEELSGTLQKKFGYAKDEAEAAIEEFMDRQGYSEKSH